MRDAENAGFYLLIECEHEGVHEMNDLTTERGVVQHMSESTSVDDWNRRVNDVKRANGNNYPAFWISAVILSGLAEKTAKKWNGSGKITIETW
jgi:hypothetical protein